MHKNNDGSWLVSHTRAVSKIVAFTSETKYIIEILREDVTLLSRHFQVVLADIRFGCHLAS